MPEPTHSAGEDETGLLLHRLRSRMTVLVGVLVLAEAAAKRGDACRRDRLIRSAIEEACGIADLLKASPGPPFPERAP